MKYYRPETLSEYFDLVRDLDASQCTQLAGGTDLVPGYEHGSLLPAHLIDIKHIPELRGIRAGNGSLEIGSLTTIEELRSHPMLNERYPALVMAAKEFAGKQIRHRATIGGNIVNASPAGDTLPPLYIFDARVSIISDSGQRTVPINDFIQGPNRADLNTGELVHSILLPANDDHSLFIKLGLRRAMAIAVVNFAIRYTVAGRQFSKLNIAAGAVAPTIVSLDSLAAALLEQDASLQEALGLIEDDIAPISDIRASAAYRRSVLRNLLGYHLREILENSHGR